MSNPSGPDQGNEQADDKPADVSTPEDGVAQRPGEPSTESAPAVSDETPPIVEEHPTEVMAVESAGGTQADPPPEEPATAVHRTFRDGLVDDEVIETTPDPATEIISTPTGPFSPNKPVAPQMIPPRGDAPTPPGRRRSWGWVVALILVIAALVAVAILGTLLLTRDSESKESQEEKVRSTIENFDVAVQNGDLATLRSITCGATRDSYVKYDDRAWADTHARVAAAKQYPVVASIDQVVVNADHAEANVDDVHGVCAANPVHPQLRPAVPRRPVEDLPGADS